MDKNTSSGGSVRELPLQREAIAAGLRRYAAEVEATIDDTPHQGKADRWIALQARYDGLLIRARDSGLRPGEVAAILREAGGGSVNSPQSVAADTRRAVERARLAIEEGDL